MSLKDFMLKHFLGPRMRRIEELEAAIAASGARNSSGPRTGRLGE